MKKIAVIIMIILGFGAALIVDFEQVSSSRSQCNMGGGSQHKHGDTQEVEHIDRADATPATKGYAFINDDGNQEATITIKNGYEPGVLVVKKGIPLKLNFDLQEEKCTGTVVLKDFGIQKKLVPYELDSVEFTPDVAGLFTFACPMHMIEGSLIVKE